MYHLQFFDRSCRILDDEERVIFAGSFRECEDWLDTAENQGRLRPQPLTQADERPNWLSRIQLLVSEVPRSILQGRPLAR